ncbi:hypothetical protein C7212DRAFT_332422 [Tuber magnatum]|uniref:Uncharacterized protein n=1 Tax=Tuber magnatum TaxID=42249 RepID=A0A317SIS7_9PEZI|nr:hypothetical protein C7212DRAFT_332422 [Tuber magnatum]
MRRKIQWQTFKFGRAIYCPPPPACSWSPLLPICVLPIPKLKTSMIRQKRNRNRWHQSLN